MKSMYVKDVFYEDHDRLLKLLYFIEHERASIDLSEKRHNNYVQGSIARSRRYDRERMIEMADERPLDVEDDVEEVMKIDGRKKRRSPFIRTVVGLRKGVIKSQAKKSEKQE